MQVLVKSLLQERAVRSSLDEEGEAKRRLSQGLGEDIGHHVLRQKLSVSLQRKHERSTQRNAQF